MNALNVYGAGAVLDKTSDNDGRFTQYGLVVYPLNGRLLQLLDMRSSSVSGSGEGVVRFAGDVSREERERFNEGGRRDRRPDMLSKLLRERNERLELQHYVVIAGIHHRVATRDSVVE